MPQRSMNRPATLPSRALALLLGLLVTLGGCVTYASDAAIDVAVTGPSASPAATPAAAPTAALVSAPSPHPTAAPTATTVPTTAATPEPSAAPTRTPTPSASPTPAPTPRLHPRPHKGPFSMDLYRRNAMVSQLENYWCLPAAMQTMMNIIDGGTPDRSYATQKRLYGLARRLSTDKLDGKGGEPIGWARGLTQLGYGRYVVSVHRTRGEAIRTAAKALRMTGRPVGIIAWRGAHSWVMSGFRSTADPALTDRFQVTSVAIEDVWYPRISSIWGRSTLPDTWIPVDRLGQDYLPYRRPGVRYPGLDGRYLLVLPVGTATRSR